MNKIHLILLILVLGFATESYTQTNNLILNPSFEEKDSIGCEVYKFNTEKVRYWNSAGYGTSDYMHVCKSQKGGVPSYANVFQIPRTGYAFARSANLLVNTDGFYEEYREYLQGTLRKPINAGQYYPFRVYVNKADSSYCISNFALLLSDTMIVQQSPGNVLTLAPYWRNDSNNILFETVGWQMLEGFAVGRGGERYLTFGNVDSSQKVSIVYCEGNDSLKGRGRWLHYNIDDMALIDTSEVDTVRLCVNDSLFIDGAWQKGHYAYTSFIGGIPIRHYVKPVLDTSRVSIKFLPLDTVDKVLAGYVTITIDTTVVLKIPSATGCDSTVYYICGKGSPNGIPEYVQVPISVQTLLTDEHWYIDGLQAKDEVKVWDIQGKSYSVQALNSKHFLIENMSRGMYFYHILREGRVLQQGKLVKVE